MNSRGEKKTTRNLNVSFASVKERKYLKRLQISQMIEKKTR